MMKSKSCENELIELLKSVLKLRSLAKMRLLWKRGSLKPKIWEGNIIQAQNFSKDDPI